MTALDALWTRVSTIFHVLLDQLNMSWCDVTLFRSDSLRTDDTGCAADTETEWKYRSARVVVYLPTIAHFNDSDIRTVLAHELVHILVAPMESKVPARHTDLCELAVENVARSLVSVLDWSHQ